jgi:hypothetical protein
MFSFTVIVIKRPGYLILLEEFATVYGIPGMHSVGM